jgi:putative CocE/NonD family hydrolase
MADAHGARAGHSPTFEQSFQNYEFPDPERFVPDGYALVRVDVRGTGRSPGFMELLSRRETLDYNQCIEWAAAQPWSSGKVGLSGVPIWP